MSTDAYSRAFALVQSAGSWQALRAELERAGLLATLDSREMMALADAFQSRAAGEMTDLQLLDELGFWADGGSYDAHLQGHDAVAPRLLLAECRRRGWSVRDGLTIGAVVSPPEGGMLTIRASDLLG